jgi:hypothetical protein
MPFSFKPDISQPAGAPGAATPAQVTFGSAAARQNEGGGSFIKIIAYAVFGAACLMSAGLVGYKYYLTSQIEKKRAEIESSEQKLAAFPLENMRKLSAKMKIINQLLKEHPSVNVAFRILEDSVEHEITYTNFNLRYDKGKQYMLQLDGVAPTYKNLAQQADTYKREPYTAYVSDIVIESLSPDPTGWVEFVFSMPITIAGLLPEDLILTKGERVGAVTTSTSSVPVASSTTPNSLGTGTSSFPIQTPQTVIPFQ